MPSIFRSEDMSLCQLLIQHESVYQCVAELGELGIVQFVDANYQTSAQKRLFITQVKKCCEIERKLRIIEEDIINNKIKMYQVSIIPEAPNPREMIELEDHIEKVHNDLTEVTTNDKYLKKTFQELLELKNVLVKSKKIFLERKEIHVQQLDQQELALIQNSSESTPSISIKLEFVSGVIRKDRLPVFERMLWRMCHGIAFLRYLDIEEPMEDFTTKETVQKSVFMIFFQGHQLKLRVKKLCEAFNATLYYCPEIPQEHDMMLEGIKTRIVDLLMVIEQTKSHHYWLLNEAAKNIKVYYIKLGKMKSVYHVMNLFNNDVTQKCLIGECWCANKDLDALQRALQRGTEKSGSSIPSILNCISSTDQPPTCYRSCRMLQGFHNLVNAYGAASYKEISPSIFTSISFPFLFAVMFGDWGHGIIMFLFGLILILLADRIEERKIKDELFNTAFNGRYIILLMGLFSIYTGLIYNEFFSVYFGIFRSAWSAHSIPDDEVRGSSVIQLDPNRTYRGTPYVFGIDPVWMFARNKIGFLNSYKMKISIIFGVLHMLFGTFLSLANHLYSGKFINIVGEFVPQVIFMTSIFGYLVFMILYKWFMYTSHEAGQAPSLLITLINMLMFKPPPGKLFSHQVPLQTALVITAVACVPWMFLTRPLYIYAKTRGRKGGVAYVALVEHEGEQSEDFFETMTNQAIHTIEYCLGTVSHTASYLRLWALSLAHSQLSEVLWSMVMRPSLARAARSYTGGLLLFLVFGFWATLTVCILVVMEGLSAFLHALRLHWVEFQSKFYQGSGRLFAPFTLSNIGDLP